MARILKIILKNKKYLTIAVASVAAMSAVSYYLTVMNVYQRSIFVYADMNGYWFTIFSLLFGAVIAILAGFYLSLLVFRRDVIRTKAPGNKAVSLGGAVAGIVASGCPSCGVPLLGLIGFPLALYALPFKGLEVKALSIILLGMGIYLIDKNIKKNLIAQCKI
ncbi:MAG TPA: hypothetical protein VJB67_02285 [Patescibacteria group bacterium]|nr:hypothetical protein [Patescibacteria group bacterium]